MFFPVQNRAVNYRPIYYNHTQAGEIAMINFLGRGDTGLPEREMAVIWI
jgi:hypothetical protein